MTSEPNTEDTSVRIEIIPQSGKISSQTSDLVENEMAGESDDIKYLSRFNYTQNWYNRSGEPRSVSIKV